MNSHFSRDLGHFASRDESSAYQITGNESDLDKGLPFLLKSHSIIKNNFDQINDFLTPTYDL